MNKQELIEKYEKLEGVCKDPGAEIARLIFLEDLRGLDEPQKVQVPQFVADWLEKVKNELFGLNYDSVPSEIYDWVYEEEGNLKKLHLACAIGYTVEKEPKYTVKIKGKIEENLLVYGWGIKRYFFARTYNDSSKRGEHTRKELEEDGFGWVFDCEGIEIEEVEE